MSIFRQSLKKLEIPSALIRSYSQNPLKPPLGMCPEELNFRQDDEDNLKEEEEEKEKKFFQDHKDNAPKFIVLKNYKNFILKSFFYECQ